LNLLLLLYSAHLFTACADGKVRGWHTATGRETQAISGLEGRVVFSPRGRYLLTTARQAPLEKVPAPERQDDRKERLTLLDLKTGRRFFLRCAGDALTGAAFSPEESRVSLPEGTAVTVCSTATGAVLWQLRHGSLVNAAAFSPDGRRLVTASGNLNEIFGSVSEIRLWEMTGGEEVMHLGSLGGLVRRVRFLDSDQIAAGGEVWDARPRGGRPRPPATPEK
jgi:WD40 repeat protein